MATNWVQFAKDLRKGALFPVEDKIRNIAIDMTEGVARRTPVLTGRLRANWQLTLDTASEVSIPNWQGRDPVQDATAIMNNFKIGKTIHLSNNVIYGPLVEYGGPVNVPRAMLTLTIQETAAKLGGLEGRIGSR